MSLGSTVQELAPVVVAAVVVALLTAWAAVGYWVYRDAQTRDVDRSRQWALASVFFAPVVVVYLWERRRVSDSPEDVADGSAVSPPGTDRDRLAKAVLAAVIPASLVGVVVGPVDPVGTLAFVAAALAVSTPLSYLFVYRDVLTRRETAS